MKKFSLITGLLSITAIAPLAHATSGTINFTGDLTAATCSITGTGGTTITIPLGTISTDQVKDVGATTPAATGTTTIEVDCTGTDTLNHVAMKFDPTQGSGLSPDNLNLLGLSALTGTGNLATGVGIGLLNETSQLIKLGQGETLDAKLEPKATGNAGDKTAKILVRAAYFKTTSATPTPGQANGSMAFTLSYK